MDFRESILAFQTTGGRAVIDQIITYMHERADSRAVLSGDSTAVYVALRAITVTYQERSAFEYDPSALPEYSAAVYEALGVNIFGGTDFSDFRANAATIRRFLGMDDYEALVYALSKWLEYRAYERAAVLRRSLTPGQRAAIVLEFTELVERIREAARARYEEGVREGGRGNIKNSFPDLETSNPVHTHVEIAEKAGIGKSTWR